MTRRAPVLLVLLALAGCGSRTPAARHAADRTGDTRVATWVDPDGDGLLQRGPGEALRTRTELGGAAATTPGRVLATLVQLTDTHVRDEESPARATFLDRLGPPFGSTFRPQEALSTQVLDGAARAVRALGPQLVVATGDVTDNAQRNELDLALTTLRGGRVDPDSGRRGYQGPQQASNPDPSYYRPEVDPPQEHGLLTAAQRPFLAAGTGAPLAAIPGNHDLLLQGELPPTPETDAVATGDRLLTEPDLDGVDVPKDPALAPQAVRQLLDRGLPGRSRSVGADPARVHVAPEDWIAKAASTHGPRADRVVDLGARVRVVLLDVSDRAAGGGSVKPGQVDFLRRALRTDRWVLVATHQPLRKVAGADALRAVLDASPRVLATLAGDSHHNRVRPRRAGAGGGYWELETSSLADFPMQARALRVRELRGGGAVLETWMLDTVASPLTRTARDLAFLDAQGGRPQGLRGGRLDRNVRLVKLIPR